MTQSDFDKIQVSDVDRPLGMSKLHRTSVFARLALLWEAIWPQAFPFFCVVSTFLAVSWMGLWPNLSDPIRWIGLVAFACVAIFSLLRLKNVNWPTAQQVNNRIERSSGLDHRPVTAQQDSKAEVVGTDDPFARALWQEHQKRMSRSLTDLKAGVPSPQVARLDPYALRGLVGLFLFIGFVAGWGNWSSRIGDAFRSHDVGVAAISGRIDAWLKPPVYTNRPPIFLTAEMSTATVPEGSELVVRTLDIPEPQLLLKSTNLSEAGKSIVAEPSNKPDGEETSAKPKNISMFKFSLNKTGAIQLSSKGDMLRDWTINVIADDDPKIVFVDEPVGSARGALEFSYSVEDDYGVSLARTDIKSTQQSAKDARPLVPAPDLTLPLPSRRAKEGTAKTSQDLTAHPWAGAEVEMTLIAEDEAGQTGKSKTITVRLPERIFTKPLALAIVDERRNLALDSRAAPQVAQMLDIITSTHPDEFIKDMTTYTALRVAFRTIKRAESDDELRQAIELLWETALAIEDGDLSLAERRLRDAQERLAKALEDGASDAEIDELMKELRAAMENFMQELAEQMRRNNQNQQAMPIDPNAQVLRQQDLERMMQQIEDLAKSGSKDAARRLLEEMQRMMNNLQTARPGQQQQQQTDEFSQQMNKLGEMMRQQQQLMDETFNMQRRQQQGDNRPGDQNQQGRQGQQPNQRGQQNQQGQQGQQQPMTAEEFAEAMKELRRQQGELQRQMQEMQDAMRGLGLEPGDKLDEAGEAMGQAEQDLGQGDTGQATGQQGRALQAMREGAQQMMQNMQNQAGEQGRRGERGQHGQQSRGERDPLGRQSRSQGPQLGDDTKVPGEIDAQRAREILDAIRRKLGESSRPKLELDYLDRLLPTR